MKTTLLSWVLLLCVSFTLIAQNTPNSLAQEYLQLKGEVILRFKINDKTEIQTLTKEVSIVNFDASTNTILAMLDTKQYEGFLSKNIPFQVTHDDNIIGEQHMTNGMSSRMATFPLTAYPTYADYETMMNGFAADHPAICKVESIGTTTEGDKSILFVKLSDNVNANEQEPRVMYTSSMHGDEIAGYPMMLNLIDYLLVAYNDTSHPEHLEIKNLLDNNEVWINPLANPDGTYRNSANNTSVANATRGNANNVDLNRNYPDPDDGPNPDGNAYQVETQAFMDFADDKHFVLSANFHGGIELANYPWDTFAGAHPDEDYFIARCEAYRDLCQANSPAGYFDALNNGITNGFAWYEVQGGRQDYQIFFKKGKEITIELSNAKTPPANQLAGFWNYNRAALIDYLVQINYGIRGVITDADTNQPIPANITVLGRENYENSTPTELPEGDYYRPLKAGTYSILIESTCYQSQTITGVTIADNTAVTLNAQLVPLTNATPTGLAASNISATTAILTWDEISGATFEVRFRESMSSIWTTVTTATNTLDLSGLTALTDYETQVRSICTGGVSSPYSASVNFTTLDPSVCSGINSFPYTESFESGFGDWTNATGDDINWTRDSGGTPSTGTGPSTGQDGAFYIYTEASTNVTPPGSPTKTALLNSPCIDLLTVPGATFSFGYHMNGTAMGTMEVLISTDDGSTYTSLWSQTGSLGDVWNDVDIDLSNYIGSVVQIQLKGTTGTSWSSDMAIDSIAILLNTPDIDPPTAPTNLTASNISSTSADLTWAAATDNIGVTSYEVFQDGVSIGTTSTTTLTVLNLLAETSYIYTVTAADAASNTSGPSAPLNVLTLATPACSGISNFPYLESFETGFNNWTNATGDDIDWTRDSGGTPSSGTGPSTGQDGSFYLYTEASTNVTPPGSPNKTALLYSPCIDLTALTGAVLEFGYHMNGTAMGTLEVSISTNNGSSYTPVWSVNGSQGDLWQQANIDLSSYTGSVINIQFNGTTGTGWSSDIAIDALAISSTAPDIQAPTEPTNLVATNVNENSLDLSWSPSTDDTNVTGYNVYQDGALITTVTATNADITSLSASTTYTYTITAFDAVGNTSNASIGLDVTTLSPDTVPPTQPANLTATNTTDSSTTLSWSASTDNVGVTFYEIYQDDQLISSITGTTHTVLSLSSESTYTFKVKALDAAGNESIFSNSLNVTTQATAVSYCNSQGTNVTYEYIDYVGIGGIDNTTGANGGYGDFTDQTGIIGYGSNTIILSVGFTSSSYTEFWSVWIDYNHDGIFETSEEVVASSTTSAANITYNFTVPSTAMTGNTRMRVSMQYNVDATPCQTFTYGEVEDYTLNITGTTRGSETNLSSNDGNGTNLYEKIQVYPNPVTEGVLFLNRSDQTPIDYRIISELGQVIQEGVIYNNNLMVDELSLGTYFIELRYQGESMVRKFIKS